MPARLSQDYKVEIIFLYGQHRSENDAYRKTANHFNRSHAGSSISHMTVQRLVCKFKNTGTVNLESHAQRRRSATNENNTIDVLAQMNVDPHLSIRTVAERIGVSQTSVFKMLHAEDFHPYKPFITQDLHAEDHDIRAEYCEIMLASIIISDTYHNNIIFSDEACFYLNGGINRHNCHYWSSTNPHWKMPLKIQGDPHVMVWCGLSSTRIYGPYFLTGNVDGPKYLQMLQTQFYPDLQRFIPPGDLQNIIFQQDGAPPHYSTIVRQWLDEKFHNHWIGRRGPVNWPARSPDLTPLDFFLWGYLKSKIFSSKPTTIAILKEMIAAECASITAEILANVISNWKKRCQKCIDVGGDIFEHLPL